MSADLIYRGDTLQKKIARYATHDAARCWMDYHYPEAWKKGLHVFLASREGGDASVLSAMGVPFHNMVAIDRDLAAITECNRKWPEIHAVYCEDASVEFGWIRGLLHAWKTGEKVIRVAGGAARPRRVSKDDWVIKWAEQSRHPYIASAFWDFCGHIDRETMTACSETWARMSVGSVFSVAVLKGREKEQAETKIMVAPPFNRASRRSWKDDHRATVANMIAGRTRWDTAELLRMSAEKLGSNPACVRWHLIKTILELVGYPDTVPEPVFLCEYRSKTKESNGSPMLIVSFAKRWVKNAYESNHAPVMLSLNDELTLKSRDIILQDHTAEDAARLLNVPVRTAVAWKAHHTRGTYDRHVSEADFDRACENARARRAAGDE